MQIIPAILGQTKEELQTQYDRVAHLSDSISFDVMDGEFVSTKSPRPSGYPKTDKTIFWHLMVQNPLKVIGEVKKIKTTYAVLVQAESKNVLKSLDEIKSLDIECGLVFHPDTSLDSFEHLIKQTHIVQIMTVVPGEQGRRFVSDNLKSIPRIRSMNSKVKIAVDGGVNLDTIKEVATYRPDYVFVGSYLTKAEDPKTNWDKISNF